MVVVSSSHSGRCIGPESILLAAFFAAFFYFASMCAEAVAMSPEVEAAFRAVQAYSGEDRIPAMDRIDRAIGEVEYSFGRSREFETRLIELLSTPGLGPTSKKFAAKQLGRVSTERSVAVFEPLLYTPDMSAVARAGLQGISGLDAQDALLRALSKTNGELRAAIIDTIGAREDRAAVPALVKFTGKGDPRVMRAAIRALGEIGGPEAVKDLLWCRRNVPRDLRALATDAYFRCAEKYAAKGDVIGALDMYDTFYVDAETPEVRRRALEGILIIEESGGADLIIEVLSGRSAYLYNTALDAIPGVRGLTATETLATALPTFPLGLQARVVGALASRGDPAALPAIHLASKHSDLALCDASIRALGSLANRRSVSILLAFAAGQRVEARELARASLLTMMGPGVNDALVTAAMGSKNTVRTEAVRMIVAREVQAGVPVLLRIAQRDFESLQIEALRGLGTIATADDLPALVDVLIEAPRSTVRDEAARAIVSTAVRVDRGLDRTFAIRRALQHGVQSLETKVLLVEMLGEIGDDRGLPAIRAVVKRLEPLVADAAIRVLSAWPTPTPLDDLESLAKRVEDPNLRRRAVDGYLQLLRKPSARSLEETLKRYKWAIRIATTSEQHAAILSDLQQLPGESAHELIETLTADRGGAD